MQLDRTIILPTNDLDLAKKLFGSLIEEEAILTMIVLGKDNVGENAVEIADKLARVAPVGFARKVVWVPDTNLFDELKSFLKDGNITVAGIDPSTTVCIAVSLTDQVMEKLTKDSDIDFLTVERAFLKAGEI